MELHCSKKRCHFVRGPMGIGRGLDFPPLDTPFAYYSFWLQLRASGGQLEYCHMYQRSFLCQAYNAIPMIRPCPSCLPPLSIVRAGAALHCWMSKPFKWWKSITGPSQWSSHPPHLYSRDHNYRRHMRAAAGLAETKIHLQHIGIPLEQWCRRSVNEPFHRSN